MKNVFAASLAIAVAHAVEVTQPGGPGDDSGQTEGCSANGDISLQRPPNQFVRIDSAWGPDRGDDWYDDEDCIPLTDEQAFYRGCWVGTWYGQQVPDTLPGATRYNMWAQYRCPSDPENRGYYLNVARAERCLNAWADVEGDCSTPKSMRWSTMTDELKQFNMSQWDGDYDNPQLREGSFRPCGLLQHSWEVAGELCADNKYRWARNDVLNIYSDGEMPLFDRFFFSYRCPFFEFCWNEPWCTSPSGPG
jgi:hypothetical protein